LNSGKVTDASSAADIPVSSSGFGGGVYAAANLASASAYAFFAIAAYAALSFSEIFGRVFLDPAVPLVAAVPAVPVPVPVVVPAAPVPSVLVPVVSVVPESPVSVAVPPSSKDLVSSSPVEVPGSVAGGPVGAVGIVIGVNVTAASFVLVYVLYVNSK